MRWRLMTHLGLGLKKRGEVEKLQAEEFVAEDIKSMVGFNKNKDDDEKAQVNKCTFFKISD